MTRSDKAIFREVLYDLLPLRAPSAPRKGERNLAREYVLEYLGKNGLPVQMDEHGNITVIRGSRAIVAHTDAVAQGGGKDREQITDRHGIIRSYRRKRPIGGDDKVGVAIAVALILTLPDVSLLLFADEEIGCVGVRHWCRAHRGAMEPFDLAVQCDRRGCSDLVAEIGWTEIASKDAREWASFYLPHRTVVSGGMTDVESLVEYGMAKNAFNLSCGYYEPHTAQEYIVLAHAQQALLDAKSLLVEMPEQLPEAKGAIRGSGAYGYDDDFGNWDWRSPDATDGRKGESYEDWQRYYRKHLSDRDDATDVPADLGLLEEKDVADMTEILRREEEGIQAANEAALQEIARWEKPSGKRERHDGFLRRQQVAEKSRKCDAPAWWSKIIGKQYQSKTSGNLLRVDKVTRNTPDSGLYDVRFIYASGPDQGRAMVTTLNWNQWNRYYDEVPEMESTEVTRFWGRLETALERCKSKVASDPLLFQKDVFALYALTGLAPAAQCGQMAISLSLVENFGDEVMAPAFSGLVCRKDFAARWELLPAGDAAYTAIERQIAAAKTSKELVPVDA